MRSLLLFLLLGAATAFAGTPEDLAKADALREKLDERGALAAYQAIAARDTSSLEALWKASFLASTIGGRYKREDQAMIRLGQNLAATAMRRFPDSADARFSWAVSLAMRLSSMKVSERAEASKELRRRIAAVLEKDPDHPGAWYLLGRWRLAYASLNAIETLAAKAVFGGVPAEATLANAEIAYRKAIAKRPYEPLYQLDLARTLVKQKRESEAIQILAAAKDLKPRSADDPGNLEKIRKLLAKLQEG